MLTCGCPVEIMTISFFLQDREHSNAILCWYTCSTYVKIPLKNINEVFSVVNLESQLKPEFF